MLDGQIERELTDGEPWRPCQHTQLLNQMNRDSWITACLTYVVPYMVNIHRQYVSWGRASKK
jgi:hypothetical protein